MKEEIIREISTTEIHAIIGLWRKREEVLTEAAMFEVPEPLRTRLRDLASFYRNCIEELSNVPTELLTAHGLFEE